MITYGDGELERIVRLIPLPVITSYRTGFDGTTIIARFQTFYLKITYDGANDSYRTEGYLYNVDVPRLNLSVPRLSIAQFLGQLTEDNYLKGHFHISWPIRHDNNRRR